MLLSWSRSRTWTVSLLCGAGSLIFACDSDDNRLADGEAGAAGAPEAGAPSSGGGGASAGAAGEPGEEPSAGGVPAAGGNGGGGEPAPGGAGGEPAASGGAGGDASSGGAPPVFECVKEGSVTALNVSSDAIYPGCRGGIVRFSGSVQLADPTFVCCGATDGEQPFEASVSGKYDFDGGVRLEFQVPRDAAPGSYGFGLTCGTEPGDHTVGLQVNAGVAPFIKSITANVAPGGTMTIQGENLAGVDTVRGIRAYNGNAWDCEIDTAKQTSTSISCTFPEEIPPSVNEQDYFVIDVIDDTCGAAPDAPVFWVKYST